LALNISKALALSSPATNITGPVQPIPLEANILFFHRTLTASSNSRISMPGICSAVILAGGGVISSLACIATAEGAGICQPACLAFSIYEQLLV